MTGCPAGVSSIARFILRRCSTRYAAWGVWVRGAGTEHRIAFLGMMMMMATLDMPSPGYTSLTGMVIPVQRSPVLGELVVTVSWMSGREEDHVIAVAEGHKLQTLEPDHRSKRKWMFRVSHLEKW
jgi:hypothetical protein